MVTLQTLLGIIPSIILPSAALIQLRHLLKTRSADGASAGSWTLFGIANICLYFYTGLYDFWTTVSFLGTATVNFIIVGVILRLRR